MTTQDAYRGVELRVPQLLLHWVGLVTTVCKHSRRDSVEDCPTLVTPPANTKPPSELKYDLSGSIMLCTEYYLFVLLIPNRVIVFNNVSPQADKGGEKKLRF